MFKLYSRILDHNTVLECWGSSTKHPDSIFYFSDFEKSIWVDEKAQIFQWLLECASKFNSPFHAYELAEFAMDYIRAEGGYQYSNESEVL